MIVELYFQCYLINKNIRYKMILNLFYHLTPVEDYVENRHSEVN